MPDLSISLRAAFGSPRARAPIGGRRSHAWHAGLASLAKSLGRPRRLIPAPFRSPASLFSMLHGRSPPSRGARQTHLSWGDLFDDFSLEGALARVKATARVASGCPPSVCWNGRWLKSIHHPSGVAKRNAIKSWLDGGKVVLLQETHWDTMASSVWAASLAPVRVLWTPAGLGPRGGLSGGTAVLLPPPGSPKKPPSALTARGLL